jgi:hypothetical protein
MTTVDRTSTRTANTSELWKGAGITAVAALLFPRVNAVIYDHEKIWQLDSEAKVLAPLVVVVTLALFAGVGLPLWHNTRQARGSLVIGILAAITVVAYWSSLPIALGGLAMTLGLEGLRRDNRPSYCWVGIILGAIGVVAGATLWLANV